MFMFSSILSAVLGIMILVMGIKYQRLRREWYRPVTREHRATLRGHVMRLEEGLDVELLGLGQWVALQEVLRHVRSLIKDSKPYINHEGALTPADAITFRVMRAKLTFFLDCVFPELLREAQRRRDMLVTNRERLTSLDAEVTARQRELASLEQFKQHPYTIRIWNELENVKRALVILLNLPDQALCFADKSITIRATTMRCVREEIELLQGWAQAWDDYRRGRKALHQLMDRFPGVLTQHPAVKHVVMNVEELPETLETPKEITEADLTTLQDKVRVVKDALDKYVRALGENGE